MDDIVSRDQLQRQLQQQLCDVGGAALTEKGNINLTTSAQDRKMASIGARRFLTSIRPEVSDLDKINQYIGR